MSLTENTDRIEVAPGHTIETPQNSSGDFSRKPVSGLSPHGSKWPKADMTVRDPDVRFRGQSGHPLGLDECLLLTLCGLSEYARIGFLTTNSRT